MIRMYIDNELEIKIALIDYSDVKDVGNFHFRCVAKRHDLNV